MLRQFNSINKLYGQKIIFNKALSTNKKSGYNISSIGILSNHRKMSTSPSVINSLKNVMLTMDIKTSADNAKRLTKDETTVEFMHLYQNAPLDKKKESLLYLCRKFSVNHENIIEKCEHLLKNKERDQETLQQIQSRLNQSLKPGYVELFLLIARLENGVKFLIDMRHDALKSTHELDQSERYILNTLQTQLKEMLSLWFSVGLLHLDRVTWNSPAALLEKIGKYEAVHHVKNWVDLKHRLGKFRRCYAFYHSTMTMEPVIVLHVELTDRISNNVKDILKYNVKNNNGNECLNDVTTAIFYSITSTQVGLQGIELGLYLIQAVVKRLQQEIPNLSQFSSLSPIPGFRPWLIMELANSKTIMSHISTDEIQDLESAFGVTTNLLPNAMKQALIENAWMKNEELKHALQAPLVKLCAVYLNTAKKRGYAWDPVCHFHLRNGATMWRINWLADLSPNGLKQSCGIMVNYRYYLENINENSKDYILNKSISKSSQIEALLNIISKL